MTARTDNIRFVIKFVDKKESDWGYIWNGCIHIMGIYGSFSKDNTFASIKDAENHIVFVLNSGWCRDDVTREYFEIIPVKQYKGPDFGFFWYTEDCYNEIKALH